MPARPRLALVLALVLLPIVWGLAFVGIKEVLAYTSPSTLTILRFAVADVFLVALLIAWPRARPRFARGDRWRLAVLAVTGVPVYHLALNWGEQRTSASVASLIVSTAPAMVAVGSALVLRTPLTLRAIAGIALAFSGVAVLAFSDPGAGANRTRISGVLVALIAPVGWAVYTIVGKPLTARSDPLRVTVTTLLAGSLLLAPLVSGATLDEARALPASAWAWVLFLGAGASVGGYVLFVFGLSRLDPTRVSMTLYAVPVVAVLGAWLIRGEALGWSVPLAAAMVVGGVALVQRAPGATTATAEAPLPALDAEGQERSSR